MGREKWCNCIIISKIKEILKRPERVCMITGKESCPKQELEPQDVAWDRVSACLEGEW